MLKDLRCSERNLQSPSKQRHNSHLNKVAEFDADFEELGRGSLQIRVGQHAVLQAAVDEVLVHGQHLVHVLHRLHLLEEGVPVGLHHLDHHVVADVLHRVHHPLAQRERRPVQFGRVWIKLFRVVVRLPHSDGRERTII